ncbi:MAG: LuxR C-terminal-related transcriptional regulator [Verrucomicrobiales bacterium]
MEIESRFVHLQALWRQLAEDLEGPATDALLLFMKRLCELLDGDDCHWYAGRHGASPCDVFSLEIFAGWWLVDIVKMKPETGTHDDIQQRYFELIKKHGDDPLTVHAIEHAGQTRVHLRQDCVGDDEWDRHWKYRDFLEPIYGVKERMHAIYHLAPECEAYLLIDRSADKARFSEEDRALAYLALSGAGQLMRRLFFERGLLPPAMKMLSSRERDTFKLLLSDLSEKEIATELGVSPSTAHQYVAGIYHIFRVRGRSGFLSLCRQF